MERRFLAPLDVRKMPGVGKVLAERLKLYGLRTIGDIARIDRALVAKVFGKVGGALHDRAQGLDNSPVEQRESVKSMSRERTFETDTLDADFMESTLRCLIETLGGELRKEGLRARSGTLKVRYSDFRTQTCSVRFPAPTDVDDVIYTAMKSLFRAQATRRVRVRLVGVALSGLCRDPWQLDLFHQAREQRMRALCECLDGIREKYGFSSILRLREKGYERRSAFPE
jgi:DNA polymerase-4